MKGNEVCVLLLGIVISENLDIKNKATKFNIPAVAIYISRVVVLNRDKLCLGTI